MGRELDTTGTFCPVPILKTGRLLKDLDPGEVLVVFSDDPGVLTDMPDFCSAHGHEYLGHFTETAGVYRLTIRKRDDDGRTKALGLLSGGLDSTLAARLLQDQGVQVRGVHFSTGFCMVDHRRALGRSSDLEEPERVRNQALKVAGEHTIPLEVIDVAEEYLEKVVLNPKHGYGAAFNPCIDCRIFMLRKADELAREQGADVVFTGEVVGQRPKSQTRASLDLIEKEAGMEGRLLRPLSARHLPETEAETDGRIDRERLWHAHGRSRKEQFELATRFAVDDFPTPGGGCCYLADHNFARRIRDLVAHSPSGKISRRSILLLKVGRHLRLGYNAKVIFGRDEAESTFLAREVHGEVWGVHVADGRGSFGIIEGKPDRPRLETAAALAARYSRQRGCAQVQVDLIREKSRESMQVAPATDDELEEWVL
jgi:TusA-related sulfurtransferase